MIDPSQLNSYPREYLKEKDLSNNHKESHTIVLSGSTKESVNLNPDTILYIESSANFVNIYYLLNNFVKQTMLRTSLSQIDKDLQSYIYLLRCHRAYIVNFFFVKKVDANSKGLRLKLHNIENEVPVSRSYMEQLKNSL